MNNFQKFHWCKIEQAEGVIHSTDLGSAGKTLQERTEFLPSAENPAGFKGTKNIFCGPRRGIQI